MIKNLAITPPVIGRISIGRVIEKNGKRLPEKDDQFTITTQIQHRDGWLLHPLDEALRKDASGGKLRTIPVTMLFNDPDLNMRAEYTMFDRQTGRTLCMGDGEQCRRQTADGLQQLPCPGPDLCPVGKEGNCKPYGRLSVRIGDDQDVGVFIFRTTGYNSIRTLTARLRYYHAISGGNLATLPLSLKLRGKSTTQSHRAPIYYVDLAVPDETDIDSAVEQAKTAAESRTARGINQAGLDEAARQGYAAAPFEFVEEEGLQAIEEFMPTEGVSPNKSAVIKSSTLKEKLVSSEA